MAAKLSDLATGFRPEISCPGIHKIVNCSSQELTPIRLWLASRLNVYILNNWTIMNNISETANLMFAYRASYCISIVKPM
jgi:hypothetical protein